MRELKQLLIRYMQSKEVKSLMHERYLGWEQAVKECGPKEGLVSVIIPAYNAEKYIKEAIDSALAQTYKNIEIIVVDDGSTDNTRNIVSSYKNTKIKLITHDDNKNHGMCKSRYLGYVNSRGEYIAFLDSDDIFLPEKIEKQIAFMKKKCGSADALQGYFAE